MDVQGIIVAIDEFKALGHIAETHAAIFMLGVAFGIVAMEQQSSILMLDAYIDG